MIKRFSVFLYSRGVSLTLIDLVHYYKKTVCSRTLTRDYDKVLAKKRCSIKTIVSTKNVGFWFDNYSKFMRHSKLLKSSYECYSWSTVASIIEGALFFKTEGYGETTTWSLYAHSCPLPTIILYTGLQ
jgi:hypothetical protein